MGFCYHRWSVLKRWTTKDGEFRVVQKCRRCSAWKREDIELNFTQASVVNILKRSMIKLEPAGPRVMHQDEVMEGDVDPAVKDSQNLPKTDKTQEHSEK